LSPLETIVNGLIAAYAVLAVGELLLQFSLAQLHWLAWRWQGRRRPAAGTGDPGWPTVSVIYPIYREYPAVLDLVMRKASECLLLPGLELIFLDDGSPNLAELLPVYRRYEGPRLRVVLCETNRGKRQVQHQGFGLAAGAVVITVDSDTLIDPEGIRRLVRPLTEDPRVGAVTGDVGVVNRGESFLARLIGLRYWIAFNLERAAQSFTGSMLCCSGPFSAYRREVLDAVKDAFIQQRFLGRSCTYGDDRHLTNLVLALGYETRFEPGAVALTYVPATFREFIPQQTRWNKSFYRELFWTLKATRQVSLYSLWDMLLQPALSLLFILILSSVACAFLHTRDPKVLLYYGCMLVLMASLRALYGVLRTGRWEFLLFACYGFVHVLVLMPVRLKALLTLNDPAWGTRGSGRQRVYRDFWLWFGIYWGLVLGLAAALLWLLPDSAVARRDSLRLLMATSPEAFLASVAVSWVRALPFFGIMLALFTWLAWTRPKAPPRPSAAARSEAASMPTGAASPLE
jgi:hyaluronan synthase/N-acetylglucosaminyltransferase